MHWTIRYCINWIAKFKDIDVAGYEPEKDTFILDKFSFHPIE